MDRDLIHDLAAEKTMRCRLEEELLKMQNLTIFLETQLKSRTQELSQLRSEHEKSVSELSQQIGACKSKIDSIQSENETLKHSMTGLKLDYFRATDSDIEKTSKIDELYGVIQEYQNESKSLHGEIESLHLQISDLTKDNSRLLQKLSAKKPEKFSLFSPTRGSAADQRSLGYSSKSRSQILALQKAKSRIDMQIHLLSKFD